MSLEISAPKLTVTILGSGTSQGVPMIGCRCAVCRSDDPQDKRTRSSIYLAIYGSAATLGPVERIFHYAFNPKSKVPGYVHVLPHVVTEPFELCGIEITPLPVPHGAVSTLGFLFSQAGRKLLAYLSDCGSIPEPVRAAVAGAEVLIIDGLRDKPHPTHLTVGAAVEIALALGARRSFLTHQTHEKRHVDRMRDLPASIEVAYDGMKIEFELTP